MPRSIFVPTNLNTKHLKDSRHRHRCQHDDVNIKDVNDATSKSTSSRALVVGDDWVPTNHPIRNHHVTPTKYPTIQVRTPTYTPPQPPPSYPFASPLMMLSSRHPRHPPMNIGVPRRIVKVWSTSAFPEIKSQNHMKLLDPTILY